MNSLFGSRDNCEEWQLKNKELSVELQEAWANYESAANLLKRVGGGSSDANFTIFGVGCSFADSEEERKIQDAITEQACRGWFRSASSTTTKEDLESTSMIESRWNIPLIDDSLFSEESTIQQSSSLWWYDSRGNVSTHDMEFTMEQLGVILSIHYCMHKIESD